jgi:hypothetical protein
MSRSVFLYYNNMVFFYSGGLVRGLVGGGEKLKGIVLRKYKEYPDVTTVPTPLWVVVRIRTFL